jgi:hypothetical protein
MESPFRLKNWIGATDVPKVVLEPVASLHAVSTVKRHTSFRWQRRDGTAAT